MATSNGRRRRERRLAALGLLLAGAILAWALPQLLHQQSIIQYEDGVWRTPDKSDVCPGDVITFPVSITVQEAPAFVRIVESWCRADGICPWSYTTMQHVALVEPYHVNATAQRTIPADLTPGEWQLNHINESHTSGRISVSAWAVRVKVGACGAVNE